MLFNIYYDGNSPADFRIDLTENVIIKPNSQARLLKCFIPHAKSVIMTDTKIMDLVVNDDNATPIPINIPATGNIDIETLVTQINAAFAAALVSPNDNISGYAKYDITKGHAADSFEIRVEATSLFFSVVNTLDWAKAPYSDITFLEDQADASAIDNNSYTKLGTNGTNAVFTDNLGNPLTDGSMAQGTIFDSEIKVDRYAKTTNNTLAYPPSGNPEYGNFSFVVGSDRAAETATFWVGIANDNTADMISGLSSNDVAAIENLKAVTSVIFVPAKAYPVLSPNNTSTTAYAANGLYILEDDGTGSMNFVVADDTVAVADGDEISIVLSEGANYEYYIRRNGAAFWTEIPTIQGSVRYTVKHNDTPYPALGIYTPTTADKEILVGFNGAQDESAHDKHGQYIDMTLTSAFGNSLGFTQLDYTDDTSGSDDLAALSEKNDKSYAIVEASADCPFVNINIPNLPLKGFINYDTRNKGLSNAPTLGVVSRFDQNGSLESIESLYVDFPTHTVPLENSNEIQLSQLHFQLRDGDGKVPTDLGVPLGIVFDISESR
jgi:hypothetical protein